MRTLSKADLDLLVLDLFQKMQAAYQPGRDLKVTPENVYQPAVMAGRDVLEGFMENFLLPGSAVEGLEHLDDCLARLEAGRSIIFLPEHRGNLDTPSFYVLVRHAGEKYTEILDRLIYIAGRKLNESSEQIKMFTEKYSRLIIVPRRDFPEPSPGENEAARQAREEYMAYAARINRAAFRELVRLRREGRVFVLFPLGGRLKPDADNIPVPETTSYLRAFDTAYPISMEGNVLPPLPRMEDERPIQDKVVFRVGAPIECKPFLEQQRKIYEGLRSEGRLGEQEDYDQFTVNRIMKMLEELRLTGRFDPAFVPEG
jgi:glycerol-3-phosphate O-acyltransferase